MKRIVFSTVAALALVLPAMANAGVVPAPVDVTGTWSGSASCKGLEPDGITKISIPFEYPAVRIAMISANNIAVEFDDADPVSGGMCGVVNGANGRGIGTVMASDSFGAAVVFDMDAPMASIYFKSIKVDSMTGAGSIQGTGTFIPYVGLIATCKFKLTRTNDVPPTLEPGLLASCGAVP